MIPAPVTPPRVRVAALQMVSTPVVDDNLATAARLIAQAKAQGAALVLLPEYFCVMGQRDSDKVDLAEPIGCGPIQHFLADQAQRHQLWVIGGTVPLQSDQHGKVRNTTLVFNPQGEWVCRYDKIHLFSLHRGADAFDESRTIVPGDEVVRFLGPAGLQIGLSICYDLRFPELYRSLGSVDLVVVPSAFTYATGQAHWEVLLRARAIENQCYVLAAAQGGAHLNQRRTWGHSMLIDPWGEIKAVLAEGEGVVMGEIDPKLIVSTRTDLPALTHRATRLESTV